MPIEQFSGAYRWLSNFYPVVVEFDGDHYTSVEHAYQAAKTVNQVERMRIKKAATAGEAKRRGKALTIRPDWDSVKVSIMLGLLKQKFQQADLKRQLLETNTELLVEGNWWNDTFWGVCNGVGSNVLGSLLMEVRDELAGSGQEPDPKVAA